MNPLRKIWCRTYQAAFRIATPILPYREPDVIDSLNKLGTMFAVRNVHRVLLVTDQGLVKAGLAALVEQKLREAGIEYSRYDKVVPNPTVNNVEEAREQYIDTKAEAFVALGGGSAMDCAKAAAARVVRPRTSLKHLGGVIRVWRKLPPLIAIPTTAGTGSETTPAAIVTDPQTRHKYALMDFVLIPPVAVHDYRLTIGLPKHITSSTGLDALVHAVEAYIGQSTTEYTRAMAIEATRLIHENLYKAYVDGQNAIARQNMLRAAFCAGNAFSRSYVGYVHCIAHSLGGMYGTPHGLANAVLLPIVLREYGSAVYKRLAELAREAGVVSSGYSDAETAHRFINWVQELNDKMDIPRTIDAIREEDIPTMVTYADAEGNPLYPVPVLWDKEELSKLYRLAMTVEKTKHYSKAS